jgi:molybdopterin synthase catalytic subunit
VYLTETPIDTGALLTAVQSPERGGVACFLGAVRNHHGGREVLRLEYSAYAPMVEAECARIVAECQERWDVAIALRHRVGALEIGDTAVAVVAASAHRDAAFAACRYVIEELKLRVPIWKREYYADGSVGWVSSEDLSGSAGQDLSGAAGQRGSEAHDRAGLLKEVR